MLVVHSADFFGNLLYRVQCGNAWVALLLYVYRLLALMFVKYDKQWCVWAVEGAWVTCWAHLNMDMLKWMYKISCAWARTCIDAHVADIVRLSESLIAWVDALNLGFASELEVGR